MDDQFSNILDTIKKYTLSSRREGLMPKNGLMAIAGTISSSGSEGRGAIQMPPVSEMKER